MAVAGDIVIKLAADFAEFVRGMTESQKRVEEFGKQAAETGEKLDAMAANASAVAKGLAIGAVVLAAVNEVKKLWTETEKAALEAERLAKSLNLTSEQVQALQVVSANTGRSMEDLAKTGKANSEWLATVTREAKDAGYVIENEYTKAIKEAARESEEANKKLQVLFAPVVAGTKSWIADALERMKNDLAAVALHEGIIDKLTALAQMLGYGGGAGSAQDFQASQRAEAVANAQRDLRVLEENMQRGRDQAAARGYTMPVESNDEIAKAKKRVEDATIALNQYNDARRKAEYGGGSALETAPAAPGKGGGAKGPQGYDVEAQIRRYELLGEGAEKAYATIRGSHEQYLEDLQREVRVQQQIDDTVEKIHARGGNITPDELARLRIAVDLNDRQRDTNARLLSDMQRAEQTESKFGDGSRAYSNALRDLNRQQATTRLTTEAYNRSLKQTEEATDEAARQARRYDDDLGSLAAGFESAMAKWSRANDLFAFGEKAFGGLMTAMGDVFDILAQKSSKTFEQVAADFALMLSKMAAQAAISEVFKWGLKALGYASGAPTLDMGGSSSAVTDAGTWGNDAAGGDVLAGRSYRVGEFGPETYVPSANGRIVPMASGGAGGGAVVVNLDMKKAEGARDPGAALEFGRRVKQAVMDVISNEKRPGGTLFARGS